MQNYLSFRTILNPIHKSIKKIIENKAIGSIKKYAPTVQKAYKFISFVGLGAGSVVELLSSNIEYLYDKYATDHTKAYLNTPLQKVNGYITQTKKTVEEFVHEHPTVMSVSTSINTLATVSSLTYGIYQGMNIGNILFDPNAGKEYTVKYKSILPYGIEKISTPLINKMKAIVHKLFLPECIPFIKPSYNIVYVAPLHDLSSTAVEKHNILSKIFSVMVKSISIISGMSLVKSLYSLFTDESEEKYTKELHIPMPFNFTSKINGNDFINIPDSYKFNISLSLFEIPSVIAGGAYFYQHAKNFKVYKEVYGFYFLKDENYKKMGNIPKMLDIATNFIRFLIFLPPIVSFSENEYMHKDYPDEMKNQAKLIGGTVGAILGLAFSLPMTICFHKNIKPDKEDNTNNDTSNSLPSNFSCSTETDIYPARKECISDIKESHANDDQGVDDDTSASAVSTVSSNKYYIENNIKTILQTAASEIHGPYTLTYKHQLFLKWSAIMESNIANESNESIESLRENLKLSSIRDSYMKLLYEYIDSPLHEVYEYSSEVNHDNTSNDYVEFLCGCFSTDVPLVAGMDKLVCDVICS